jgi:molecular chaperone DnaK
MKKVIGIDLGTTNSVIAFKDLNVRILKDGHDELIKSVVSFSEDESVKVGKHAIREAKKNLPATIFSVKRLMGGAIKDDMVQKMVAETKKAKGLYKFPITRLRGGTDDAVAVVAHGREYTPEQISARILSYMKSVAEKELDDTVTHAVITVPAYFTEPQKNATRIAAKYAGLKVLRLLAEPTAAAISYGVEEMRSGDAKTVVIYDFGGGTFDLSVLTIADGQYLEQGKGGDRWLGGDDIDKILSDLIYERVCEEYDIDARSIDSLIEALDNTTRYSFLMKFKVEVEKLKIILGVQARGDFSVEDMLEDEDGDTLDINVTVTRKEFEARIRPIVQRSIKLLDGLLQKINYDVDMIDHILLVGGTSCIPLIKEMLEEHYGPGKIMASKKPMLAVAEGAAILAHRLDESYEPEPDAVEAVVHDIAYSASHSMYIMLEGKDGRFTPEQIVEGQAALPQETIKRFKTTSDNQKIVKVEIKSDEENNELSKSSSVAFMTLEEGLSRGSELIFEFNLSVDELLSIDVYPKGQKNKLKRVPITRGQLDAKAFATINDEIEDFNSGDYSLKKKRLFEEEIVSKLRDAEAIELDDSVDKRWSKITYEVKELSDNIRRKEENDFDYCILGKILLNNYKEFVDEKDVQRIRGLMNTIKEDQDPIQTIRTQEQLEKITDQYSLFTSLFLVKIAADIAIKSSPGDAKQLNQAHDTVVHYLRQGDMDSAMEKFEQANTLAKQYIDLNNLGNIGTGIGSV